MKVLMVNKFHYLKGGSEKYYFELSKLLEQNGHEVAFFSMQDEKNIKTGEKEYFVKNTNMNSKNIFKAFNVIYSKKNKQVMKKALQDFKPDIVHINNFQRQLSASIIEAIKEKNIPIVYTAHDLQSVCPASAMLNKGKICEACKNGKYANCIKKKCIKDSLLKSLLTSIEAYYYKKNSIYNNIDLIITPSDFAKNKILENNLKLKKINTIHNFVNLKEYEQYQVTNEGYALFSGRLSIEKGINNLIKAFTTTNFGKLYIAGDGPEKENILKYIKDNKLEDKIKLLGFLEQKELKEYISKCSFVILPSICYENCPYSILEAFSMKKPVIAARIGGIPELVKDGYNGYLYKYDNVDELFNLINSAFTNTKKLYELGENALKDVIEKYSTEVYYKEITNIYNDLVNKKGGKNE